MGGSWLGLASKKLQKTGILQESFIGIVHKISPPNGGEIFFINFIDEVSHAMAHWHPAMAMMDPLWG